jgi:putative membrane protein
MGDGNGRKDLDVPGGSTGADDPRVYFAAERTFLAWIRTGLGLMGVGFAVSRFGLFLREMRAVETNTAVRSSGFSMYSGVGLVVLGVVINVVATAHHLRLVRELRSGTWTPGISRNAVMLALVLALVGVGMAVYLLYLR